MKQILSLILLCGLCIAAAPENSKVSFSGTAFDYRNGSFIYTENNEVRLENNTIKEISTRYKDSKGNLIAERTLTYNGDPTKPNLLLKDFRIGYIEGVSQIGNNKIKVFYRDNFKSELKEKYLDISEPFVIDAGLNAYFRQNWSKLKNGETLKFLFIAPAKLDYFTFRVQSMGVVKVGNRDGLKLKMELNNFFLRTMIDPMIAVYSLDDQTILSYEGVSNIVSESGVNYKVKINYDKVKQ